MAEYKFDFSVNTDGRLHVTELPKTLFPITRNGHTFTLKTGVSPNQIPVYLTYKDGSLFRAHCNPTDVDAMFEPLPEGTKIFKYSKNELLTRP
jgi:hypothetical protein